MRRSHVAKATLILTSVVLLVIIYTKLPHSPAQVFHYIPPKTTGAFQEELQTLYGGVQTFVLFVGHARSGHSLIGAMLDAHPEIIIPHEFNLIAKWNYYKTQINSARLKNRIFFDLHSLSREQAMFGNRAPRSAGERHKYYCYHVHGQWQGKYRDKVKVIGDKKGTSTCALLRKADDFQVLEEMQGVLQIPLKFIHVIRNPFDNIATKLLREFNSRKLANYEGFKKVNESYELDDIITSFFENVESAKILHESGKFDVIDIYGHEIISRPQEIFKKLCNFLGVACDREYIDACSKLLYSEPSLTRNSVVWTKEQIRRVTMEMKKYSFMEPFSFNSL